MIRRIRLQRLAPQDRDAWQNSIMDTKNIGNADGYWRSKRFGTDRAWRRYAASKKSVGKP